jgi:hypothetical protein
MKTWSIVWFLISFLLLVFISNCACEEDEFGEVLRMEIPVEAGAERNLYRVGDALWVMADFPKEVTVVGNSSRIELNGYNFFSELNISEISEEQIRFYSSSNIVTKVGFVELNQVGGYNYTFEETGNRYMINFGVVLSLEGTFMVSSRTDSDAQRGYSHPSN